MELQAITGQLYILNGETQTTTAVPGILAQSPPSKAARGRERDFLFVHLVLTGQVAETAELTQDLLDAISRRFYRETGSVTAALRHAAQEANDLLLRFNLSGTAPNRLGAVSCAVLRGGELFVVQAGESLVLLGHNFGVERLPPHTPDRVTPLGQTAGLDMRYFHQRLQTGDMMLLADPRISHLPSQTLQPALVDTTVELGLAELKAAIGTDSARVLLIEFTDEAPASLPEAVQRPRKGDSVLNAPPKPLPQRESSAAPQVDAAQRRPQPERPFRNFINRAVPQNPEDLETTARRATAGAAMGLSRATGGLAAVLQRIRPAPAADEPPNAWVMPALIAVFIPLLVAVVVVGVYLQRGQVREFSAIRQDIIQTLTLAEEAGDQKEVARQHYQEALVLVAEAEQIRTGDAEIGRLRQQATEALDRLDGITRLNAHPLYTYNEQTTLKAVVLQDGFNGGIYTLDTTGNVYRHETDESYTTLAAPEPALLVFPGQAVSSHVAGTVVDILWRPQGNAVSRDGLAMLDSAGALVTFYPNFSDTRALPLDLSSEWQLPVGMTTYDERLYVLDAGAGRIWKYFPDGDGFVLRDDERVLALPEDADLQGATDIALYSEDGGLVVVYGDGRIRYYDTGSNNVRWDEQTLLNNGLSYPLVRPVAVEFVGKGLNASIFVLDAGNGRLVQISRGGTVLAQYRATDETGQELLNQASDFAIAETPLRIFVTANHTLYQVGQE